MLGIKVYIGINRMYGLCSNRENFCNIFKDIKNISNKAVKAGVGKMDMLIELGRRIQEGKTIASLKAKRIIVFDTNAFTAVHNNKQSFEIELLELMSALTRLQGRIAVGV